jgi:hypothetical protein
VDNGKLLDGIRKFHLQSISERGIIRFVSGSWGSGKTHFFRRLRELAFEENCLVSNVELNAKEVPLNKFERVFSAIIDGISSRASSVPGQIGGFRHVLREVLGRLGEDESDPQSEVLREHLSRARERLMADTAIDIDFKKAVMAFWETYLPEVGDAAMREQARDEILAWFVGSGTIGQYRRFGISKMVSAQTAKYMLRSIAAFARLTGFQGLVILFDEAEQFYSIMRKASLKDAWNTLLSLINNVGDVPGLFMVYATTPDFYMDPEHGIINYGALAGRVGQPLDKPPRAIDNIWNFDQLGSTLEDYQEAARRILDIYRDAYPEIVENLPTATELDRFVEELQAEHPEISGVRFWRVLTKSSVTCFDDAIEGDRRTTKEIYRETMDVLRED